jgi:hypothetical protein
MKDRTRITLDNGSYYLLVELKGMMEAKTWAELISKLHRVVSETHKPHKKEYPPIY